MTTTREYPTITRDTAQGVAIAAAYSTIKYLYMGHVKQVKDKHGEIINHDGNAGGDSMIQRLYYGFNKSLSSAYRNMLDAYADAPDKMTNAQILEYQNGATTKYLNTTANETDDCINTAVLAILEDIDENDGETATEDAYKKACTAVRNYVYQQDNNTGTRIRAKYDAQGNLIDRKEYKYIKYPHLYIDAIDADGNTAQYIDVNDKLSKYINGLFTHDTITEILSTLNETQKQIVHYIAKGYTNTTICRLMAVKDKKTGETVPMPENTLYSHIHRIRQKAKDFVK